jgi:predicted porin
MQDNMKMSRPRQRLLAVAIGSLLTAAAMPAFADAEVDALKRELAEQRKLIEKLLADKEAKPAAPVAAAPAAPAAVTSTPAVRIYGIVDGGVEHLNNIGVDKAGVTRMPSITATLPSRLGIAGTKELGDGYKGIATLEIGYNTDDGTLGQGGRLFGRQLFAGVDTPFGAVTYGRQWSMMFHAMLGTDILGPNVYALGSMDPYLASMRYDNSVAWRGSFGGFSAGALYSFGRSVVAAGGAPAAGNCAGEVAGSKMCRGWSLMAKYDAPIWGVAGAIDEQKGGTGSSAPFFNGAAGVAFTRAEDTDRRSNLGGYFKLGTVKLAGGWLGRKVDAAAGTTKSTAYYVGASAPITAKITLDGGLARMNSKALDDKTRTGTLYAVRGFYNLDKGLDAYAQVGHLTNSSDAAYTLSVGAGVSPVAGTGQTGEMVGLRYMF